MSEHIFGFLSFPKDILVDLYNGDTQDLFTKQHRTKYAITWLVLVASFCYWYFYYNVETTNVSVNTQQLDGVDISFSDSSSTKQVVVPAAASTKPTVAPTKPTVVPTKPTVAPTKPTVAPTKPTVAPTKPSATNVPKIVPKVDGINEPSPSFEPIKRGKVQKNFVIE